MCKDCKWRGKAWFVFAEHQYCFNPTVTEHECKTNPAGSGKAFARLARMFGPCYGEGKYWEKR